jgi:hypothetical protein
VAIALKHGERTKDAYSLQQVHSRFPAVCGIMQCGSSVVGDTDGSVLAQTEVLSHELVDLHGAVAVVAGELVKVFPEFGA